VATQRNKTPLFVITEFYPESIKTEPYVVYEEVILKKYFEPVIYVPFESIKNYRQKFSNIFKSIFLWLKYGEILHIKDISLLFRRIRNASINMDKCMGLMENIRAKMPRRQLEVLCLGYWMSGISLVLATLKQKGLIKKYVIRAHGYDVFENRKSEWWLPCQEFVIKHAESVVCDSEEGASYLKSKYPHLSHKITSIKIGPASENNEINPFPKDRIRIVSCSRISPIKRVDLIAKALLHVQKPLEWIHLGGVPDTSPLKDIVASLPPHIKTTFAGWKSLHDIHNFYRTTPVSFFINASLHEGLPFSIMEALSYGIPVIAPNTGGIPEVVNENTGILFPVDTSPEELAKIIEKAIDSRINTPSFRHNVKHWYVENVANPLIDRYYTWIVAPLLKNP